MSDPFFIRSSGRGQGGPRGGGGSALRTKRGKPSDDAGKKRRREADNEDDQGGFDDLDVQVPSHEDVAEDDEAAEREREEAKETPAEKRMRLARMYLQTLEEQAVSDVGGTDAAQADRDIIASRLRQEAVRTPRIPRPSRRLNARHIIAEPYGTVVFARCRQGSCQLGCLPRHHAEGPAAARDGSQPWCRRKDHLCCKQGRLHISMGVGHVQALGVFYGWRIDQGRAACPAQVGQGSGRPYRRNSFPLCFWRWCSRGHWWS